MCVPHVACTHTIGYQHIAQGRKGCAVGCFECVRTRPCIMQHHPPETNYIARTRYLEFCSADLKSYLDYIEISWGSLGVQVANPKFKIQANSEILQSIALWIGFQQV